MSTVNLSGVVIIPPQQTGGNTGLYGLVLTEYSNVLGIAFLTTYLAGPLKGIGSVTNTTISQEAFVAEYRTPIRSESVVYYN